MVSLRIGQRAIPLLWEIVETGGAIGWDIQSKNLFIISLIRRENGCFARTEAKCIKYT
jgi:hypothetical protein